MGIDLAARRWNVSLLRARFAPTDNIAPDADARNAPLPQRKRCRRLNPYDASTVTTGDLFGTLSADGFDALRHDWKLAFWALVAFNRPGNINTNLKARICCWLQLKLTLGGATEGGD